MKRSEKSDFDPGGRDHQVSEGPGHSSEVQEGSVRQREGEERKAWSWKRVKQALSLTEEGATPINWKILLLVILALFSSCYSITFLFPFVPDMILHFGYKEEEKGYYAGMVASSMFAGRIFGSYFWGWLSDVKGRRPVILICTVAIFTTNVAFGFSVNLLMALIVRFLNGLFNGLVGTCKTVLYEISDNTNQAVGMSSIALAWGSGIIIGPLLSGYLSQPATRFPAVFLEDGLFGRFPFLLPSLVAALMCVVAFVFLWFLMPETLNINSKNDVVLQVDETDVLLPPGDKSLPVNRQLSRLQASECTSLHNLHGPKTSSSATTLNHSTDRRPVYGCVVTSQGDLLLPELYHKHEHSEKSRSLVNVFKRQRSNTSEGARSHTAVVRQNSNMSEPGDKVSNAMYQRTAEVSLSHDDLRNRHRQDTVQHNTPRFSKDQVTLETPVGEANNLSSKGTKTKTTSHKEGCGVDDLETGEDRDVDRSSVCCRCWKLLQSTKFMKLMGFSDVRSAIFIYTLVSFGTIGFDDVFTIWASTDVMYSGLNFTSDKIGSALGFSSIPLVFLQLFMFPKLEARFGAKRVFNCFCMLLIFNCMVIVSLRTLLNQTVVFWSLLLLFMGLNKIAQTTCFSANGLHINNSVPSQFAGSANGIAMTFTAIGRTIAPVLGGSVFAWSIVHGSQIGFPFDVNLVFILFSFTYLLCNIWASLLPRRLDKQKKKEDCDLDSAKK